jgi:hypothetical protein
MNQTQRLLGTIASSLETEVGRRITAFLEVFSTIITGYFVNRISSDRFLDTTTICSLIVLAAMIWLVFHIVFPMALRLVSRTVSQRVVGLWWEIQESHGEIALAVMRLASSSDGKSVQIKGTAYSEQGSAIATFESEYADWLQLGPFPSLRYYWRGHLRSRSNEMQGMGSIQFTEQDETIQDGDGHYFEFADGDSYIHRVAVTLRRFTSHESDLWETVTADDRHEMVRTKILEMWRSRDGLPRVPHPIPFDELHWRTDLVRFGWDEIAFAARWILRKSEESFKPDVILCMSEVPALVIALAESEIKRDIPLYLAWWHEPSVPRHLSLSSLTAEFEPIPLPLGIAYIPKSLFLQKTKKVLVIDERCKTGHSISRIREALQSRGMSDCRFAVLWTNQVHGVPDGSIGNSGRPAPDFWFFHVKETDLHVPWGKLN